MTTKFLHLDFSPIDQFSDPILSIELQIAEHGKNRLQLYPKDPQRVKFARK